MPDKKTYRQPYFDAPTCPAEVSSMDLTPCTNVASHSIARILIKRRDGANPFAASPISDQLAFDALNAGVGADAAGWLSLHFDYDWIGGVPNIITSNNGRRQTTGNISPRQMIVRFSNLDINNESSLWVSINDNSLNLECIFITEEGTVLHLPFGEGANFLPIMHASVDRFQFTGENGINTLTLTFLPEADLALIETNPTPVDWLNYDFT